MFMLNCINSMRSEWRGNSRAFSSTRYNSTSLLQLATSESNPTIGQFSNILAEYTNHFRRNVERIYYLSSDESLSLSCTLVENRDDADVTHTQRWSARVTKIFMRKVKRPNNNKSSAFFSLFNRRRNSILVHRID